MEKKIIPGEIYRNALICVDSCGNGTMQGRFFHPYLESGEGFRSLAELVLKLEQVMDEMNFPQAAMQLRKFSPVSGPSPESAIPSDAADSVATPENQKQKGIRGTFYLQILYRQNASWQGTVTWAETRQQVSFRSVLELMHLLDSAVNS